MLTLQSPWTDTALMVRHSILVTATLHDSLQQELKPAYTTAGQLITQLASLHVRIPQGASLHVYIPQWPSLSQQASLHVYHHGPAYTTAGQFIPQGASLHVYHSGPVYTTGGQLTCIPQWASLYHSGPAYNR